MSPTTTMAEGTLITALAKRLRACASAPGGGSPPAAILWTDPECEWLPLRSVLLSELPELIVFGEFDVDQRTGPAIWLRCLSDKSLDEPALPADRPPIILLPGVGRQQLRAGEDCPASLQPLVELMYRGTLWLQRGGHDWTVSAFLTSAQGLGLDVSKDDATREALGRALREVAVTPLPQLQGRLEADDFHRLLSPDVIRDVLRWMSDPKGTRERLGENAWDAFASLCRQRLDFDPTTQPDVTAGELLGSREGNWQEVWERFGEAPSSYPGIAALMRRSRPSGTLPLDREPWPDLNEADEAEIRKALASLDKPSHEDACHTIADLDSRHAHRRGWVWAKAGHSPMARVLEPLARLAAAVGNAIGGATPDEIASVYMDRGWQADAAAWEAVALAPTADEAVVESSVRHLLLPWLDQSARAFQAALEKGGLPTASEQGLVQADDDGVVLFSDGLRYDLGRKLADRLEGRGMRVAVRHRWSMTPSVTATGKPAITPVADLVEGKALNENFEAVLKPKGIPANAQNLRTAMKKRGYQILGTGGFDTPMEAPAKGWLEFGNIDKRGHQLGGLLARRLDEELERLCERIVGLLDSGWKCVQIVTDHGWLLLPGGLPKVDLPKHLTACRWARCAVISGGAHADVPRYPWSWNPAESFAYAPGIACFNKTETYVHGGLSIQECLTPHLVVERTGEQTSRASIVSVTWRGLRCLIEASAHGDGIEADLRLEGPTGKSVVVTAKPIESDGSVSLLLDGDEHEDKALVLVLLDGDGQILAQQPTRVGTDA